MCCPTNAALEHSRPPTRIFCKKSKLSPVAGLGPAGQEKLSPTMFGGGGLFGGRGNNQQNQQQGGFQNQQQPQQQYNQQGMNNQGQQQGNGINRGKKHIEFS